MDRTCRWDCNARGSRGAGAQNTARRRRAGTGLAGLGRIFPGAGFGGLQRGSRVVRGRLGPWFPLFSFSRGVGNMNGAAGGEKCSGKEGKIIAKTGWVSETLPI